MVLSHKLIIAATILLLVTCMSASADIAIVQRSTTLTGAGAVKNIACNAAVTRASDGIFTYAYELIYNTGTSPVHTYKVQNPGHINFFGAENQPVGKLNGEFDNPTWALADTWVTWLNGVINPGQTRTFSYKSIYAPQEIEVWTYAVDGGSTAVGKTLGMGNTIPEPSSLLALVFGVAGLLPIVRRRK